MAEEADDLATGTLLPVSRIRKIIRSDPDVKVVSLEAVLLITKATVRPCMTEASFAF